ncbi:MAG: efflux RND transporter periplasmic adaptor subunit [Gemmatimonadales bacterium]
MTHRAASHLRRLMLYTLPLGGVLACSDGQADRGPEGGPPPVPVAVAPVLIETLTRSVIVTGAVAPVRTIGVTSQTTGTLLRVLVQEGDRVRQGQLLAELDGRETAAQLQRAEAVLTNAQAAFERIERLRETAITTEAEVQQARANFQIARSDVTLWRTRVSFTRILAPNAGIVTAKLVEAGGSVSTNQRLFDLADDALLVVRVQVSELDVTRLAPGLAVAIRLDALPDAQVVGRVRRVFPSADVATRLVPVEIALEPAAELVIRPGYLARIQLPVEERPNVLTVPANAAATASGAPALFVIEADTVVRKFVTFGMSSGNRLEVLTGIAEGEQVVTSGTQTLRPGQRVRVSAGERAR